ncbi:MAG: hypothetical protein V3V08_03495 [Nannocystaceae bacterium]
MIVACPSCSDPYALHNDHIAALVQVACPHCGSRVILDFEAANDTTLREPATETTAGYVDEAHYRLAVGSPALKDTTAAAPTTSAPAARRAPTSPPPSHAVPSQRKIEHPSPRAQTPDSAASAATSSTSAAPPPQVEREDPQLGFEPIGRLTQRPAPEVGVPRPTGAGSNERRDRSPAPGDRTAPPRVSIQRVSHTTGGTADPREAEASTKPSADTHEVPAGHGWHPRGAGESPDEPLRTPHPRIEATEPRRDDPVAASAPRSRSTKILTGMPKPMPGPSAARPPDADPGGVPLELTARVESRPPQLSTAQRTQSGSSPDLAAAAATAGADENVPITPVPTSSEAPNVALPVRSGTSETPQRTAPHSLPPTAASASGPGSVPTQHSDAPPALPSQAGMAIEQPRSRTGAMTWVVLLLCLAAVVAAAASYVQTGDPNPLRLLPK